MDIHVVIEVRNYTLDHLLNEQQVKEKNNTLHFQDEAAERCSMLFRPPELFNVEPGTNIDERTDIWVSF